MAEEYLKLFDTTAQRLEYEDSAEYVEPYVSYTEGDEETHYNKGIDYSKRPLTFKITSDGVIKFKKSSSRAPTVTLQYKKNDEDWVSFTSSDTAKVINVVAGDKVMFKGNNAAMGGSFYNRFTETTAGFTLEGNIMSLINSENFTNLTTLENASTFPYLFRSCAGLSDASKLVLPATALTTSCYLCMFLDCSGLVTAPALPATTLADNCYQTMFGGCNKLTAAPELPAATLANSCYYGMFSSCTGLTTAPALPATTLAQSCYSQMFSGCTSLTTAPALPATTLAQSCYNYMFYGCTSLTTAPELPATTLTGSCYNYMFNGCTNLNYIKAMFTTTPSSTYTSNWVNGVAATGTFVKNSAATWNVSGVHGIPNGWTTITAS